MAINEQGQGPVSVRPAQGTGVRTLVLVASAIGALAAAACSDTVSVPAPAKPGSILIVNGSGQAGIVGTTLGGALSVEVKDTRGQPMAGAIVNFWTSNGGSFSAPSVPSDSTGTAAVLYTFGDAAGPTQVFAAVAGLPDTLTFALQANPGAPSALRDVGASVDTAAVGTTLQTPLMVKLVDIFGNPIVGATVTWTADPGVVLSSSTSVTDANGEAQVLVTLPPNAGPENVRAHVDNVIDALFTVIVQ